MRSSAYIVPSQILTDSPPGDSWHATPIPADPTKSLVVVHWDNPNLERDFETLPDVLHLGLPWEQPPAEAIPLLQSFQGASDVMARTSVLGGEDAAAAPESVGRILRNLDVPGARYIR